jgi:hypothetical protein
MCLLMDDMPTLSLESLIRPPSRELGDGFHVRRALPSPQRRMLGPFVFFDQMGPARFQPGAGLDVRPHPHIGLATLTYLFEGEIVHRDSLGSVQPIHPGAVNWMIAGRGIVHSERTGRDYRLQATALSGIQTWIALPRSHEECAPSFHHHAADSLPQIESDGVQLRLLAGTLLGLRSPVATLSPLFYAAARLQAQAWLEVPVEQPERAIYILEGTIEVDGRDIEAGQLLICRPGVGVALRATQSAQLLLLGGEPLDGPRHLLWNFVSSSAERLEQARSDWRQGKFAAVPGDDEFIPLPPDPPSAAGQVHYP